MQDSELLRAYADHGSEAAFGALVERHVDLVHSVALRTLAGNAALAEDVAQTVFLLLAKKARSLVGHALLAGWLHRTAIHVAANVQRGEIRRHAREAEALTMHTQESPDPDRERVLRSLDQALDALSGTDRFLLLKRYFQREPLREVAGALGISEGAVKMRLGRAVERLREQLLQRGVACAPGVLAVILAEQAVHAAPRLLAGKILSQAALSAANASWLALPRFLLLMSNTKKTLWVGAALATLILTASYYSKALWTDDAPADATARSEAPFGSAQTRQTRPGLLGNGAGGPGGQVANDPLERLRQALGAPLPKSNVPWPDPEVLDALKAVADRRAAFAVLVSAIEAPGGLLQPEMRVAHPEETVRGRAIGAVGRMTAEIPEAMPLLWTRFASNEDSLFTRCSAFRELQRLGFKPGDLPRLVAVLPQLDHSPALLTYLPQAMASLIAHDSAASAPSIAALEALLEHPNAKVAFAAACALAPARVGQDPRVSSLFTNALRGTDSSQLDSTVVALRQAGPAAAAFSGLLLDAAAKTQDKYLRTNLLRTVASVQPEAARTNDEVARVVSADRSNQELTAKLASGTATYEDLVSALRAPQLTLQAAARLGELGSPAKRAVPALLDALQGRGEDERERLVEAIRKIDPSAEIVQVPAKSIDAALIDTEVRLNAENHEPARQLLMEKRMFSTWWTPTEVVAFARKLRGVNADAGDLFINKLLLREPLLVDLLEPVRNP